MSIKSNRDWNTFKFLTDTEFARNNNISRERARQLRKIHASDTDTKTISKNQRYVELAIRIKELDLLILEYIKTNSTCVNINDFLKINNLSKIKTLGRRIINKQRFEKIAKEKCISIKFKYSEYDHGVKCVRDSTSCNCDIGKLANTLKHRTKFKKPISYQFANYLANEYIQFYKEDESPKHREFYKEIDEEIEFYFDDLEVEEVEIV